MAVSPSNGKGGHAYEVLDGGDVLPGFRCPVADLFKI
jgi:hypothetical protein